MITFNMSKNLELENMKNMSGKHCKSNKWNIFKAVLLIIFIVTFIVCLVILIYWLKSNNNLKKIEKILEEKVIVYNNDETIESNDIPEISINFDALKEINSDAVAWIYIKNTDINYPVLQTSNNEYYLKHDLYKKYSSCGSIYLDCENNIDFSDENTVIYGHNLKNQKMFADLAKLYNGELGNDIEIIIYTPNGVKKYQVFASYMEEPVARLTRKKLGASEKKNFINDCAKRSGKEFYSNIDENKEILTLVTCDSTGNKRIFVNAIEKN